MPSVCEPSRATIWRSVKPSVWKMQRCCATVLVGPGSWMRAAPAAAEVASLRPTVMRSYRAVRLGPLEAATTAAPASRVASAREILVVGCVALASSQLICFIHSDSCRSAWCMAAAGEGAEVQVPGGGAVSSRRLGAQMPGHTGVAGAASCRATEHSQPTGIEVGVDQHRRADRDCGAKGKLKGEGAVAAAHPRGARRVLAQRGAAASGGRDGGRATGASARCRPTMHQSWPHGHTHCCSAGALTSRGRSCAQRQRGQTAARTRG